MRARKPRSPVTIAALFVFVALHALFMGGALLSDELDNTNRVIALGIFLALTGAAVMIALGFIWRVFGPGISSRRWARWSADLHARGFREANDDEIAATYELPLQLLRPEVLGPKDGGGIDHVTIGKIDGREIRSCNARVRGAAWDDFPVVAVRSEAWFLRTVIWPARVPIAPDVDMKRARYELERFGRRCSVYSADRYFASALIDARMIEWLEAEFRKSSLELEDHWIIAVGQAKRFGGLEPAQLIELARGFERRIPPVVSSLFPHRHVAITGTSRD